MMLLLLLIYSVFRLKKKNLETLWCYCHCWPLLFSDLQIKLETSWCCCHCWYILFSDLQIELETLWCCCNYWSLLFSDLQKFSKIANWELCDVVAIVDLFNPLLPHHSLSHWAVPLQPALRYLCYLLLHTILQLAVVL